MAIYDKVKRARGGIESLLAEGVSTLRSALGLAPEPGRYVPVKVAKSRSESLLAEQVELLAQVVEATGGDSVPASSVGEPGGVASLDQSGRVPASQLPSYVDDVVEVASLDEMPDPGEPGKIYITLDDGKCWRWGGSSWVEIASGGEYEEATATTAGLMSSADKDKLDGIPPVEVVAELPASPVEGTVYIVTEAS